MADSTLRHADVTGLGADIICMSGGRVGNVAHILKDAPSMPKMKQIVVVAGTNNILQDGETVELFATKVGKGVELLQHQAFQDNRSLIVVAPPMPPDLSVLRRHKWNRLNFIMDSLSKDERNKFTFLPCPSDIQMDGFHPTVHGTQQLLRFIHTNVSIIHSPDFITNHRIYNGVQSVYRYGCVSCFKHLNLDHNFVCLDCLAVPTETAYKDDPFSGTGDAFHTNPEGTFDAPGEVERGDPEKKRTGGDDIDVKPAKSKKTDGDES